MAMDKFKTILVVLLIVVIGGGIMGYLAINRERGEIAKLQEIQIPMEQAVREVEVSIWETANAIFYYLNNPSKTSLEEYKKQLKDVEEFMTKYKALIDTEEEKKMVAKFEKRWVDLVSKAEELIKLRDRLTKLEEKIWDTVHEADDVIDYQIQVAFVEGLPDLIEKEKAVREVEVSIWEAASAVNYYLHKQFDKPKREYLAQSEDVNEFWGKYKKLNITPAEKPHIKKFEDLWSRSVELMNKCLAFVDELKEKQLVFWESVHEADDVIDFEIQEYLKKRIKKRTR